VELKLKIRVRLGKTSIDIKVQIQVVTKGSELNSELKFDNSQVAISAHSINFAALRYVPMRYPHTHMVGMGMPKSDPYLYL
jgi:hypothetical protein